METGERPPLTKSQRREQEVSRRGIVMLRLDDYAKAGEKKPFGKAGHALWYIKGVVNSNDKEVGKYLLGKGIEIKITKNISVRVGDSYTDNSYSGSAGDRYTLIVNFKDRQGDKRSVYLRKDFDGAIAQLTQYGRPSDLSKLERMKPKNVTNKFKRGIEFNANPGLSNVKKVGKAAATIGLVGSLAVGGVVKGPEIASNIKHYVDEQRVERVITDQSIAKQDGVITVPTPRSTETPTPQPSATSAESSKTVEQKELGVYAKVYNTIIKDGIKNGYYFTGEGFYWDSRIGGRIPPHMPPSPMFLLPQIEGPDGNSTMVVFFRDERPITLTLSREDAQRFSSEMKKEIVNFSELTLKSGSRVDGTGVYRREFEQVGNNYPYLQSALIGNSTNMSGESGEFILNRKDDGKWIFTMGLGKGDLRYKFKSEKSRPTTPDEFVQALLDSRDSLADPYSLINKDHDSSTLANKIKGLLAESSQINQKE